MKTYNNTSFSLDEISKFKLLGEIKNMWRQRDIKLYQHPHLENNVVSVGQSFDGSMLVISSEWKEGWKRELEHLAFQSHIITP